MHANTNTGLAALFNDLGPLLGPLVGFGGCLATQFPSGCLFWIDPTREAKRAAARGRIDALEVSQRRPMRELLIDPANADARTRLEAIDQEIAGLRRAL